MDKQRLQGYFINLDESEARRLRIEQALADLGLSRVISRFPAVKAATAMDGLSLGEYGCLLSHTAIIDQADTDHYLLVLEDDVVLSRKLPTALQQVPAVMDKLSLDVVFLGQTVEYSDIRAHRALLKALDRHAAGESAGRMLDAKTLYRWGAFGYVISPGSLGKVSAMLRQKVQQRAATPIDNFFRQQIRSNALRGGILFPYVVGVNASMGTTMGDRTLAREHALHASLVNLYFHDSLGQDQSQRWLDELKAAENTRALAVCLHIYKALVAVEAQTSSNKRPHDDA